MKSIILLLALGACVLSVSTANIPSALQKEQELKPDASVARGGGWGASEAWSGPPAVFFAPVLAVGLIIVLWIAAYNTLRSPPPKIGFGGGAQGAGPGGWAQGNIGWGVAPTGWGASGGWAAAGSNNDYVYQPAESTQQAATVATAVEQTVQATGQRSLNDLTHRVWNSIERGEQAQH